MEEIFEIKGVNKNYKKYISFEKKLSGDLCYDLIKASDDLANSIPKEFLIKYFKENFISNGEKFHILREEVTNLELCAKPSELFYAKLLNQEKENFFNIDFFNVIYKGTTKNQKNQLEETISQEIVLEKISDLSINLKKVELKNSENLENVNTVFLNLNKDVKNFLNILEKRKKEIYGLGNIIRLENKLEEKLDKKEIKLNQKSKPYFIYVLLKQHQYFHHKKNCDYLEAIIEKQKDSSLLNIHLIANVHNIDFRINLYKKIRDNLKNLKYKIIIDKIKNNDQPTDKQLDKAEYFPRTDYSSYCGCCL